MPNFTPRREYLPVVGERRPRPAPVAPAGMLMKLQATAGNAVVQRLVKDRSVILAVQRCGGEVHPGCSCAEEAAEVQTLPATAVQRFTDGTPDAPSTELPPGSAYAGMQAELLSMLGRTLQAKTYWLWRDRKPTNLGAAIDLLNADDVNTLVQLYRRLTPYGWLGNIQTMNSVWSTSSLGIDYNGTDIAKSVDASDRFCKDTVIGEAMHSGKDCWREMVTPGTPGLHVCLPGTVHIDPHQTVDTSRGAGIMRGPNGWRAGLHAVCSYAIGAWFEHMSDVAGGRSVNVFTRRTDLEKTIGELRTAIDRRQPPPSWAAADRAKLDTQQARLSALAPTLRRWAITGLEGSDAPQAEVTNVQNELAGVKREVDQVNEDVYPPMPADGAGF